MESFLAEVAAHLCEHQAGKLQDTALIFVNKRPASYMQQHLARIIGKPFWSPSFFTTQEFFALSSDKEIADPYTQFFTLLSEYNRLMQDEGAEPLTPDTFYGIAQTILNDFNQVDAELVDAHILYAELKDIALIKQQFSHLTDEQQVFLSDFWKSFSPGKQQAHQEIFIRMWRRMPDLYSRFHEALNLKGKTSSGQIYRELAEGHAGKADFIQKFDKLAFVGFNALSKTESVIFKRWQNEDRTLFYFDTDAYYMQDDLQEAGLFLRKNTRKSGLVNALGSDKPLIATNGKTIKVYKAEGHISQAKLLAGSLAADYPLLRATDQMGKIAIVLGDESLLFPILQTIPSLFPDGSGDDLPVNVTMGFPLMSSGIFGFADIYLNVQQTYTDKPDNLVHYSKVAAFLSHPLTGFDENSRISLMQQILQNAQAEVTATDLIAAGELATWFFKPVLVSTDAISQLYHCFEYILYRQLDLGQLQKTDSELLSRVLKELNQLSDALEAYTSQLSVSFVLALMRKVLQSISVPLQGEPLQGIQIMGLLESRALDFDHVYILGVSEGHLPKTSRTPSFIPDSIRRAYDLPVPENQDAISAYMFYRLLQRSKQVSLIYNGQTDLSNSGEPSRFLRQLEFESPYNFIYIQQNQEIGLQSNIRFEVAKEGQVLEKLNRYLQQDNPRPISFSATALTTYMNCPMQFFFKYVARLKEAPKIEENIEARTIGTIVHAVLEQFYGELMATDPLITQDRIKEKRSTIDQICRQALNRETAIKSKNAGVRSGPMTSQLQAVKDDISGHDEDLSGEANSLSAVQGIHEVLLAITGRYVRKTLDHDEQISPFHLIELENKKDYHTSFLIDIGGKPASVHFKAIIDRVDELRGLTRIVDYKTGSDVLKFNSVEELFQTDGHKTNKAMIQTLFYTYIYEQVRGIKSVVPNLYLVKILGNQHQKEATKTVFNQGSNYQLEAGLLETVKTEFIEALKRKIEEIFDSEIPFIQTEVEDNCKFCPYLSICGK